jgi:hypothetical protein
MEEHLRLESWTVIFENQPRCILLASQFNRERARSRQVLQLVIEEIGNHAMKQRGVSKDFRWTAAVQTDL